MGTLDDYAYQVRTNKSASAAKAQSSKSVTPTKLPTPDPIRQLLDAGAEQRRQQEEAARLRAEREAADKAASTVSLNGENLAPKQETPAPVEVPKPESWADRQKRIDAENTRRSALEKQQWEDNTKRWGQMFHDTFQSGTADAPGILSTGTKVSEEDRLNAMRQQYGPKEPTDWFGEKNKGKGPLSPGEHQDPRIPGGYYVDKDGNTSTIEQGKADEAVAQQRLADELTRRKYRNQYREADAGKVDRMTQKEYDALSSRDRAAIDWNGLLQRARGADAKLVEKYDKNGDKLVSMDEAGDASKNLKGYAAGYERVFGKPQEGEEMMYSPAIVGLLNQLDMTDVGGDVRQYSKGFGGDAYINDDDLKAGRQINGSEATGPNGYTDSRGTWVNTLASRMEALNKRLAEGVRYGGVKVDASLSGVTDQQRDRFVQQGISGMQNDALNYRLALLGKDARNSDQGMDVSYLGSQNDRSRVDLMSNWLKGFYASEGYANGSLTTDQLRDKKWMGDALNKYGLKWNEWSDFIENQLNGGTGNAVSDALAGK